MIKRITAILLVMISSSSAVYNQQTNVSATSLTAKQAAIVPIAAFATKGDQFN